MPKVKKLKKSEDTENTEPKGEIGGGEEEETEKEGGALSDGVLDAFEETAPADLLEDEDGEPIKTLDDIIDEEDKDDLDYDPDEWQ